MREILGPLGTTGGNTVRLAQGVRLVQRDAVIFAINISLFYYRSKPFTFTLICSQYKTVC